MIARLLSLANNAIDSLALARAVRRLSEERDALATQAEELEDRLAESEADLDRILSHEDVGRVAPKVEEPMLTPAEEADVIAGAPAQSVKGYVVRWDKALGQTLCAIQGGTSTVRQENSTVFATIREAVVEAGDGFVTARIFAVAEDGTETPLPTYEEALAQLDAVRAALAVLQRPDTLSSKDMAAGEHATAVEACKVAVGLVDSPTHNLESDRLRGLILAFVEKARLKSTAEGWCNLTAEFQAFDALRRERDRADAPHGQSEIEILRAAVVRAHERIDALEKKPVEAMIAAMAAQIERLDAEMRHVLVTIARDPKVEGDDVEAEEDPRTRLHEGDPEGKPSTLKERVSRVVLGTIDGEPVHVRATAKDKP